MAQARRDMGELRPIDDLMFRVMARPIFPVEEFPM